MESYKEVHLANGGIIKTLVVDGKSPEKKRAKLVSDVYAKATRLIERQVSNYHPAEREEWPDLVKEAEDNRGGRGNGRKLSAKAAAGVDVDALSIRVLEKHDQLSAFTGLVSQTRTNHITAIESLTDEELDTYDINVGWPTGA